MSGVGLATEGIAHDPPYGITGSVEIKVGPDPLTLRVAAEGTEEAIEAGVQVSMVRSQSALFIDSASMAPEIDSEMEAQNES